MVTMTDLSLTKLPIISKILNSDLLVLCMHCWLYCTVDTSPLQTLFSLLP